MPACAMTDTMERRWATFDALPVDLIQRIAAMIPDNTDRVTQRYALCRTPMHSQSNQAIHWRKRYGACKACIAADITAACSESSCTYSCRGSAGQASHKPFTELHKLGTKSSVVHAYYTRNSGCRTKHRLHLVSKRFNEALKEPCEAWEHLTLHAKHISKVKYPPRASCLAPTTCCTHVTGHQNLR